MCNLLTNVLTVYSLFLYYGTEAAPKKWPSKYPKCYRDDPRLNNCLLKAVAAMKPFLKEGIPEFDIPPISPFIVPRVEINQGNQNDSIQFNIILDDLTIIGFDTYQFTRFEFDPKSLKFYAELELGEVEMKSKYKIIGKLLSVPIDMSGILSFKVLSSNGTLVQDSSLITKKSRIYLNHTKPDIKISVGKVTDTAYTGLFEGNEILAKTIDRMISDGEIVREITPSVEKVIEEIVYDVQKKITLRIPYDDLYPIHKS